MAKLNKVSNLHHVTRDYPRDVYTGRQEERSPHWRGKLGNLLSIVWLTRTRKWMCHRQSPGRPEKLFGCLFLEFPLGAK